MDRTKLLATATAVVLTVTGGVSALFLAVGAADSSAAPTTATTEIVEYVDADGNPLPAADTGVAPASSTAPAADEPGTPAYAEGGEYEEHDEDDHEGEDHDEEEYEDEEHGEEEDHD